MAYKLYDIIFSAIGSPDHVTVRVALKNCAFKTISPLNFLISAINCLFGSESKL